MSNSFKINIFVLCFSLVQSIQIMPLGDAEINQTEVDRYKDGGDRANQRDKDAQIGWFKRFRDSEAQRKYNNANEAQRQQDLQDDTKRATFIKMDQEGGWWDKWRNKEMIASAQRVEAQKAEIKQFNKELSGNVIYKLYLSRDPLLKNITPIELKQLNPNSLQSLSFLVETNVITLSNPETKNALEKMDFSGKNFTKLSYKELVDILKKDKDSENGEQHKNIVKIYAQETLNFRLNKLPKEDLKDLSIDDFLNKFTYVTNISAENTSIFESKLAQELKINSDDFLIKNYQKRINTLSEENPDSPLINIMINKIRQTLDKEITTIAQDLGISDAEIFNGKIDLNNNDTFNKIHKNILPLKLSSLNKLKTYANFYMKYFKNTNNYHSSSQ